MQADANTVMAIAAPAVLVVVWLVRLEGRINLADSRHADIKDALNEIKMDIRKIRAFMGGGIER